MSTLLIKNASVLVTMDAARREIADGGLYAEDGFITAVGTTEELPDSAEDVVDLTGHVVLPGLVNTHHHFYQTLTRALPAAQDVGLFDWLRTLYPIWARLTPEDVRVATRTALAELAMSGCTTAFDHQYMFPNGSRIDDQIEAAAGVGIRFHASRGSMSLGESDGGLPPDSVVETEDTILADTARAIEAFHDPEAGAMVRIVVSPCSPFSVTDDLMREAAAQARHYGVHLHTHLAETADEEVFCMETYNRRPVELMEDLGWAGPDVWYAHGVAVNPAEVGRMASAGTGVAHCPTSNMRLASGIAPVRGYHEAGVRTGLGVDGSASNDGSHLLAEARQAMLLARLAAAPPAGDGSLLSARAALEMATIGGAAVLGRDDIGSLEVGRCADLVAVSLDRIRFAGALHDPVAALVFTQPGNVDRSWVQGLPVITHGAPVAMDLEAQIAEHNQAARRLVSGG